MASWCALLGLAVLLLVCSVHSSVATIPDEDWGYVDVRPSAHMFWWLYGCTDTTRNREQVPLVMWLQGGPGGSSTGFGNFIEIGPLDVDLKPRNTTWVQAANVLFVDNPVGTGYSYVDNDSAYTTDVEGIAKDLLTLFSAFLKTHTVFQNMPFYIFCESYGGKMTAVFAEVLQQAIAAGNVTVSFKGIALGDSWISAMDYVNNWGPFLFSSSLVNEAQLAIIEDEARKTQSAFDQGQFTKATQLWSATENVVEELTDNVDFYNILRHNDDDESTSLKSVQGLPRSLRLYQNQTLSQLMNGPIKQKLKIPANVEWGSQSGEVFQKQSVDFMKDVISTVDSLLTMGVNVTVYNGQLDLICCTVGTIAWMDKLKWPGMPQFKAAKKVPVYPDTDPTKTNTGAFYQSYRNLAFYWILSAGHMVPQDNGDTALTMLRRIIAS